MDKTYFISQSTSLSLVIIISLIFTVLGLYHSKKFKGINNYLTANRDVGLFSLTTSLVASALGAWILFGPAAAATWGGIGAVIGYALGTAFPMIFLIFLGKKIRTEFPKGSSLIEFMRKKFGKSLFKLILLMTIFYMFIFLCAEVTAVAVLINYISGAELWITALIVLLATLTYTLYGGLRASIFTDNIQMIVISILLLISITYILSNTGNSFSFEFIEKKNPQLLSSSYVPSYTAGLTFFIAVAATNLFHQGNWQRVYAAKNYQNDGDSTYRLFYDTIKGGDYRAREENVYSWKANNGFKFRELIPAISITLGTNINFEKNNPFPFNNVFGNIYRPIFFQNLGISVDEEPFFHLRGTLATQSHFLSSWVFVTNFSYDRYLSIDPQMSYILTLTHTLNPLWSVYIESQGNRSELYRDSLFRLGFAYLYSDNIQVEATIGGSTKSSPSRILAVSYTHLTLPTTPYV